ncbi:MAG: hypothetical protein Kow0090_02460 [Myxococcota bacterium]
MDKKELEEKISNVIRELEKRYGPLSLVMFVSAEPFALDMLTMLVSAPWLDNKTPSEAIAIIRDELWKEKDLRGVITRVTPIHTSDPLVRAINSRFDVTTNEPQHIIGANIHGVQFDDATIMVSGSHSGS